MVSEIAALSPSTEHAHPRGDQGERFVQQSHFLTHPPQAPVQSLETPSCLFFNLRNRLGSWGLCSALCSDKARGQRGLWQRVTAPSFSHASRAHPELCQLPQELRGENSQGAACRQDTEEPLVPSATGQAGRGLMLWDGSLGTAVTFPRV